ncbi:MAG: carboxypeptidase regulatory-like domain-containing protein [Candidatus Methanoperedens sp.]|nr:carboxypeptidase regulatory-like domain-containing protein [Candidatus Methanoperedens sp.]
MTTQPLTVTLSSDPTSVIPGQESTITVTVAGSDGKEISDASVLLSSNGKLDPGSGTTDEFGRFYSTFTGSAEGKVTVNARAKKDDSEGKGEIQIEIKTNEPQNQTIATTTTITGKVMDAKTGNPIQGAIITLGDRSAATDPDGKYKIEVNTGEYSNLTVTKQGYEKNTRSASVPEAGTVVDFVISPAPQVEWWSIMLIFIIIVVAAGIIYFLYRKKKPIEKEDKAIKEKLCIHCKAPMPKDAEFCPKCGKKQEGERRFCVYCGGTKLNSPQPCSKCGKLPPSGKDVKNCKNCGEVIPEVAKFCSACGAGQPV